MGCLEAGGTVSWTKAKDLVGFLGVAGSLVFVGLEIRQNTAAAHGQTRQDLATLNQEWLMLLAGDSAFSELYFRAMSEEGEIAPHETNRVEFMRVLEMRRLENVYFQFKEGLVDSTALGSYGLQQLDITGSRFREWWIDKGWREAFHPDFVAFLERRGGRTP